jgi:hypothetical protein
MRRTASVVALALAAFGPLVGPARAAVSFPIEYSGNWRLAVSVTNSSGTGQCSGTETASMTLLPDRTATWQRAEMQAFVETPTGKPPSCEVRSTGKSSSWSGTHDGLSQFTLPSGSASAPPLTGEFDAQRIRTDYRYGSIHIVFDMPVAVDHLFAIEPDPSVEFEFHKSILDNKGFKFVLRDPHGRDHLDLGTLKISVGGVDTTRHVVSRLEQGIVPYAEESPDLLTRVFRLKPDPTRLMQGHDVFAIPYNGLWRIELRVCDKGGLCFGKSYDVYFGPFVTAPKVFNVTDLRCSRPSDPFVQLQTVTIGNLGIDAPRAALYLGLTSDAQGTWTYALGDVAPDISQPAWWQGLVRPFIATIPLASGFLYTYGVQNIPDDLAIPAGSGAPLTRRVPFPGGDFRFVLAMVDGDTGALWREEHEVTMCDR